MGLAPPAQPASSWQDNGYAVLRMPSSELRRVLITCRATIGVVGNAEHSNIVVGKAGRNRGAGVRPTVRGYLS